MKQPLNLNKPATPLQVRNLLGVDLATDIDHTAQVKDGELYVDGVRISRQPAERTASTFTDDPLLHQHHEE